MAPHATLRAVGRRLLLAVPLLVVVSSLSFVLVSLIPGDAAKTILGPDASPEEHERLRHQLGLDLPLHEQYWEWTKRALGGDLGTSLFTGQEVTQAIGQRLSVTLSLIVGALVVMLLVGVPIGVFTAVKGGFGGRLADGLSLIGFAVPGFWLGAILIELFAVKLQWFPAVGYVPLEQSPRQWLESLVLPVIALAVSGVALIAKQTRESMLDNLASEHVRMAWANGIPAWSIYYVYAFKNTGMRVITILGLQAAALLGGTVLIENVFALPGLGGLAVNAATQQDLPMVQAVTIVFTLIIVAVNLVVDVTYTWLDPRVRIA